MTQKEKARAYDEALEKGRIFRDHLLETGDKGIAGEIEYIFPALSQSEDEQIRKALIEMVHDTTGDELWVDYNVHKEEALAWLEKQGKKQPIIVWHSISEEPEEMKELFCEWESDDATWHDVAFYDKESHTFRHAKMPINVTKWVYVDELLEKQVEQKPFDYESANFIQKDFAPKAEPKKIEDEIEIPFGAKDSELQEATYYIPDGFHAEIEDDKVIIKKGDKSAAWSDEDEENLQQVKRMRAAAINEKEYLAGKINAYKELFCK